MSKVIAGLLALLVPMFGIFIGRGILGNFSQHAAAQRRAQHDPRRVGAFAGARQHASRGLRVARQAEQLQQGRCDIHQRDG